MFRLPVGFYLRLDICLLYFKTAATGKVVWVQGSHFGRWVGGSGGGMDRLLYVNLSVTPCLHTSDNQVDHIWFCYEGIFQYPVIIIRDAKFLLANIHRFALVLLVFLKKDIIILLKDTSRM